MISRVHLVLAALLSAGVCAQDDTPVEDPCAGKHWSVCTFLSGLPTDRPVTPLEESNLVTCVQMIKEVMLTGATQPGLNIVASEMYHVSNPGPYPFSFSLGSNQSDFLDDVRIVHPFLPLGEQVSTTLEGLTGSDELKQLYAQGFENATELAQSTCCQGELFGFAAPFSQSDSNADKQVDLQSSLRYYVAMSGKLNQTDEIWYTACPYTDIPVEPRSNSNFPAWTTASLMPRNGASVGGGRALAAACVAFFFAALV